MDEVIDLTRIKHVNTIELNAYGIIRFFFFFVLISSVLSALEMEIRITSGNSIHRIWM